MSVRVMTNMSFRTIIFLLILYFSIPACLSASIVADTQDASVPGQRRMLYGSGSSLKSDESTEYSSKPGLNPMNPFLSIRPFLPSKPTFSAPFVDPNFFIEQKEKLLNNMLPSPFGSESEAGLTGIKPDSSVINPQLFIDKKTKLLNNLFVQPPPSATKENSAFPLVPLQRSLVPGAPSMWDPALSPAEIIKAYTEKKANFLDTLFKTIASTTEPTAIDNDVLGESVSTVKPTIVPPSFWLPAYKKKESLRAVASIEPFSSWPMFSPAAKAETFSTKKSDFLEKLFNSIIASSNTTLPTNYVPIGQSATVKPTIVPPDFWIPSYVKSLKPVSKTTTNPTIPVSDNPTDEIKTNFVPFAPLVNGMPIIDPSTFIDNKQKFLNTLFDSLSLPKTYYGIPQPENSIDPTNNVNTYAESLKQLINPLSESLRSTGKEEANTFSKRNRIDSEKIRITDLKKFLQLIDDNSDVASDTASDNRYERTVVGAGEPISTTNAKDKLVENILTELANIKDNMLETTGELIQMQKETTIPNTGKSMGIKKKPSSSYVSPYKAWGKPTTVPTADPLLPIVTKLQYLNHVFDTLLQLEQDAKSAANEEVMQSIAGSSLTTKKTSRDILQNIDDKRAVSSSDINIHKEELELCSPSGQFSTSELSSLNFDPSSPNPLTPEALLEKSRRIFCHLITKIDTTKDNSLPITNLNQRSIKMAVHQGYQSLPPGSEELLQAGGGGESDKQEGGGLRLQNIGPMEGQGEWSNHHHHNHQN